jgi:hypothetical protein
VRARRGDATRAAAHEDLAEAHRRVRFGDHLDAVQLFVIAARKLKAVGDVETARAAVDAADLSLAVARARLERDRP